MTDGTLDDATVPQPKLDVARTAARLSLIANLIWISLLLMLQYCSSDSRGVGQYLYGSLPLAYG